jgi:hypothetical protein
VCIAVRSQTRNNWREKKAQDLNHKKGKNRANKKKRKVKSSKKRK